MFEVRTTQQYLKFPWLPCLFHRDMMPRWTHVASGLSFFLRERLAITHVQRNDPILLTTGIYYPDPSGLHHCLLSLIIWYLHTRDTDLRSSCLCRYTHKEAVALRETHLANRCAAVVRMMDNPRWWSINIYSSLCDILFITVEFTQKVYIVWLRSL